MTKGAEDRGMLLLSKKVHVGSLLKIYLKMPMPLSCIIVLSLLCLIQVDVTEAFSAGGGKHNKKSPQESKKHRKPQQHGRPTVPRPIIPFDSFSHLSALKDGIEILPASHGKGMGAFTTSAIAKGSTVGEYTGEHLTQRDVEARYWDQRTVNKHDRKWKNSRRRRNQGLSGDYLFDMGNGNFIDGEDADVSSWCRFANHASPNDNDDGGGCCGDDADADAEHADFKCNVEVRARSRSSSTGTCSSAISKPQIPTLATTEMDISALPSKTRKGRQGDEKQEEELHLYFVALRDIEVGTELCYDYGIDYWDEKIQ